jgi:peptide/nickel transport system substrate-binding protein
MKSLTKLTILLVVLGLLAACGPTEAPPEPTEPAAAEATSAPEATEAPEPTEEPEPTEAAEPVILRYADKAADLGTLDPHFAAATNDRNVVDMIFNGLIRYKPGDGTVFEPDLATELPEPEIVDGKQVWTFNLRSGVMCHPSEAVPAY